MQRLRATTFAGTPMREGPLPGRRIVPLGRWAPQRGYSWQWMKVKFLSPGL